MYYYVFDVNAESFFLENFCFIMEAGTIDEKVYIHGMGEIGIAGPPVQKC